MGIQNLLRFLSNSTTDAHISEFENTFVAIDAYCWLHKGIYSCAFELATKKPTVKYVTYCMRYIEMLLHFKVKPILVFDGRQLSSKSETEKKRREERKMKYKKGKELMRAGKTIDGRKLLAESVDVTHELALNLIKECRKKNIDCIVAPHEADAQLAFFSLRKIVSCVITEDSDLLVYGCDRVMFKMDTSGRGKLIEKNQIYLSLSMTPEEFSEENFRYMCILTGCDYLPSLPSIGPVFALKFVKMLKGNDIYDTLPKLPIYTNKMNIKVTSEYIDGFKIADNTFKHQLVYDPFSRLQVPLRPVKNDDDIVGTKLPEDLAFQLAVGNIDPNSMKVVDDYDPDETGTGFSILWRTDSLPNAVSRRLCDNSKQPVTEPKKRQRENLEFDTVQSITNDLKKHCTPLKTKSLKDFSAVQTVPKSGFVFNSKVSKDKKNVSKKADESHLLRSRYFSPEEDKKKEIKVVENANDKQNYENEEEYLQRLYSECFQGGGSRYGESKREKDVKPLEELCSSCGKTLGSCCCYRKNDEVSESQKLSEYLRSIDEIKKNRQKSNEHYLLDEINNSHSETLRSEDSVKVDEVIENSEIDVEKTSATQSFSVNLSNMLCKFDALETKNPESLFETEEIGKENSELAIMNVNSENSKFKDEEIARSPSPVFRVQKETKVLKKNSKLENILDTASTPVSVYFSSGRNSSFQVSSKRSPLSTQQKMSTRLGSSSVPAKMGRSSLKSSTVNRTLFQFGFKKQNQERS